MVPRRGKDSLEVHVLFRYRRNGPSDAAHQPIQSRCICALQCGDARGVGTSYDQLPAPNVGTRRELRLEEVIG